MRLPAEHGVIAWVLISIVVLVIQQQCYALNVDQDNAPVAASDYAGGRRELAAQQMFVCTTAQQFVDAVRSLREHVDTIINIPAGAVVNLTEAVELRTLPVDTYGTGSLTVRGGMNGTRPSILHFGWRSGLTVRASATCHAMHAMQQKCSSLCHSMQQCQSEFPWVAHTADSCMHMSIMCMSACQHGVRVLPTIDAHITVVLLVCKCAAV